MEKFSAEIFYRIGCLLGNTIQALGVMDREGYQAFPDLTPPDLSRRLIQIGKYCRKICLKQSARFTQEIIGSFKDGRVDPGETKIRVECLQKLITGEMEEALFLWVPPERAEFYSKGAKIMVGGQCCERFKSIQLEIEEAAKCYALGRYTASAFHLMRSTEAGVKALAKAIHFTPPHNQWEKVFDQMKKEFQLDYKLRPQHWKTHGKFLEKIWGDLRAVSKAWRNDVAHLVDTYSEEEAKNLLTVIPMFFRDLAKGMDENGKLY